ncbi:hypothetical protein ZHAS_00006722 [Anopheles sinensis]|uniref:Uncharacterized protein n=1 Tax=Anopheles sinensis TaxID=74873 RepID=A0A084VM19_ANOSI|nr:hypothetical protein ZHAS_00006722 [Anopheles sinensis]
MSHRSEFCFSFPENAPTVRFLGTFRERNGKQVITNAVRWTPWEMKRKRCITEMELHPPAIQERAAIVVR